MPVPKPRKGEVQKKFVPRCMSKLKVTDPNRPNIQRFAMCMSSWRSVHGGKPPVKKETFMSKIKRIIKSVRRLKTEKYRKKFFFHYADRIADKIVGEAFLSLRAALEKAVSLRFGQDAFVHDFSNKEVVIGYHKSDIIPMSSWESGEYDKVVYKLKAGAVLFAAEVKKVTKKTSYENLDVEDWVDMCEMDEAIAAIATAKIVASARKLRTKKK